MEGPTKRIASLVAALYIVSAVSALGGSGSLKSIQATNATEEFLQSLIDLPFLALSLEGQEMSHNRHHSKRAIRNVLPWTCEIIHEWIDMGSDHFPRFIRSAKCKTKDCVRGLFRCKPKHYKAKILKRLRGNSSSPLEENDLTLPPALRDQWRFVNVAINLYCDCTLP